MQAVFNLLEEYKNYKRAYAKNIKFDQSLQDLSKLSKVYTEYISYEHILFYPAATIEYVPLQLIQIYFDTATYDEIERDKKVTLEAQLSVIGGTMGLLTGFSILSGVEIIYFAAKFFMSLKIQTADLASKKVPTHLFKFK